MTSKLTGSGEGTAVYKRRVLANLHRAYDVQLVEDLMGANRHLLAEHLKNRQCLLVTTPTVADLYGNLLTKELQSESIDISMLVLPVREETKDIDNVLTICREMQRRKLGRQSMLIGMGGGVCTDLTTMAAQLFRRGIPYVRIPTTLLGQVDGSIGVKGAVNFDGKKNSLGCYYSPKAVFVDPSFLKTLPERQLSLGVSEVIKMAIVRDARLFELVEKYGLTAIRSRFQRPRQPAIEIIRRAIIGMIEELETNIYEDQTYQRLVDFGHTVGPALESASEFRMPHGDAVAISIAFCCSLAREMNLLDEVSCIRAIKCLDDCDLPTYSPLLTRELIDRSFHEATRHRAGKLNLVLPARVGQAQFIDSKEQIPSEAIGAALGMLQHGRRITWNHPAQPLPCLVFDVGGTNLRAAIYDAQNDRLLKRASRPTPNHRRHPDLATSDIIGMVKQHMDDLARIFWMAFLRRRFQ